MITLTTKRRKIPTVFWYFEIQRLILHTIRKGEIAWNSYVNETNILYLSADIRVLVYKMNCMAEMYLFTSSLINHRHFNRKRYCYFWEEFYKVFEKILIPILKIINIGEMRMKLPKPVILNSYNKATKLEGIMYEFLYLFCHWKWNDLFRI